MAGNARTRFTPKQRAEVWERWRNGQCIADIARALEAHLNRIALRLNQRPRKTLGFETPADRLRAVLH